MTIEQNHTPEQPSRNENLLQKLKGWFGEMALRMYAPGEVYRQAQLSEFDALRDSAQGINKTSYEIIDALNDVARFQQGSNVPLDQHEMTVQGLTHDAPGSAWRYNAAYTDSLGHDQAARGTAYLAPTENIPTICAGQENDSIVRSISIGVVDEASRGIPTTRVAIRAADSRGDFFVKANVNTLGQAFETYIGIDQESMERLPGKSPLTDSIFGEGGVYEAVLRDSKNTAAVEAAVH